MAKQNYKSQTTDFLAILADFLIGYSQPVTITAIAERLATRKNLSRDLKRLKVKGWVEVVKTGPKIVIKITAEGKKVLNDRRFSITELNKPSRWDGKWRVVIFDVPEGKRVARNAFRRKIKSLGFVQIQQSVWVWPYDCLRELALIAETYEVQSYVSLLEGKYLGNDVLLRKHFNLD